MRYLPFILLFALIVYALVDCVRYEDSAMPVGLPKAVWVVLIVIFPAAGAIAWLVVSRVHAHASTGRAAPPTYRQPPQRPRQRPVTRPVAPDDDPDFLASLNHPRGGDERPTGEPDAPDTDVPGDGSTGPQEHDEDGGTPGTGRPSTPTTD